MHNYDSKWKWQKLEDDTGFYEEVYRLYAKEVILEVIPRPVYCDRGRWEVHVLDNGFPINPNPVDSYDMFPRLFFSLQRLQEEMIDWMNFRKYTPLNNENPESDRDIENQ